MSVIGSLFTSERPFGPTNAANLMSHPDIFKQLFDPNSKIFDRFKLHPSLIIGRRGSGKTSFLHGVENYQISETISTARTFSEIVSAINSKAESFLFHENVSDLWEHLFILSIFRSSARQYPNSQQSKLLIDYCAKNGLGDDDSVEDWLWRIVRIAKSKVKNESITSVADIIAELAGADFKKAREALTSLLKRNNAKAVILVDSLEQYPVRISSVAHAISGLLMCVGEFNERNEFVHIRVCLPAEMYHEFMELAPNPVKNFSRTVTLHWHAAELLSIAANRLHIYLSIYYPQILASIDAQDSIKDINFLRNFLPKKVTNGYSIEEDPIAYILRHTQLMPRHLLIILNRIFFESFSNKLASYPKVDAKNIVSGIKSAEYKLTEEVCSSFAIRYPSLRQVCETVIPYLPYRFGEGDLHKIFNRHGKKSSGVSEFSDFKRMLIETAVVGRISAQSDGIYVPAKFEYTAAHKLLTSSDDELCLHPIFAEVFHFKRTPDAKPIYPFGTDPYSKDYREDI